MNWERFINSILVIKVTGFEWYILDSSTMKLIMSYSNFRLTRRDSKGVTVLISYAALSANSYSLI